MSSQRIKLVTTSICTFVGACVFFASCDRDPEIIPELTNDDVKFEYPSYFPQPVYAFQNNMPTLEGFELGRKLFYEPMLSRDNTISCGSCHQQISAFANTEHDVSHGVDGLLGTRNAPPLQNMAWFTLFMWDGGINHIESQPLGPIANPVEMDEDINNVIAKLSASTAYRKLFKAAFGDETITTQRITRAIAQFQGLMISDNSKYDQVRQGRASFTAQEQSGYQLFQAKCSACHVEPLFTNNGFRNNGLPVDPTYNDSGRMHITLNPLDSLLFKVPSLRNIEKTTPYMHDGRMVTLQECLDHYTDDIVISPTLDPLLNSGSIPMTAQEKADIIAFLRTLTDTEFLTDPRFREQ
jgi:cytochrome c peroxidase